MELAIVVAVFATDIHEKMRLCAPPPKLTLIIHRSLYHYYYYDYDHYDRHGSFFCVERTKKRERCRKKRNMDPSPPPPHVAFRC